MADKEKNMDGSKKGSQNQTTIGRSIEIVLMSFFLFIFHKIFDFVVAAHKEKDNLVSKFKKYTVLESGPDFPVIPMPIFEPEARWKGCFAVQIFHKGINGLVDFLLPGGRKLFEPTVKARFEFVVHFIS